MLRLTIWMNMPSFHQGDFFRALSACPEIDLEVVFARDLSNDRIQLGWQADLSGYSYYLLNVKNPIWDAMRLARSQRDRVHIVNGFWAEPAFAVVVTLLSLARSTFLIHSEAPDPRTPRSLLKSWLRSTFGKLTARRANGVLCISRLALNFYESLGVSEASIYPFGYFRAAPRLGLASATQLAEQRTEIIFVGQLIHRKGIDILIEAMRPFFEEYPGLYLKVVGSGDMHASLCSRVKSMGLVDRVQFAGPLPSSEIPALLSSAALLVLPSRWDGWGLVVNEALASGVPVIVSDRCGAADLVRHGVNGYVFQSEDVNALRACLGEFLNGKTDRLYLRANASEMGNRISTEAATPYFIACLQHIRGLVNEKPIPPWTQVSMASDAVS